jgi:hypothetical protein
MHPYAYRAACGFSCQPRGDFPARELGVRVPEGHGDLGTGMGSKIRVFLRDPLLHAALLVAPHRGHLLGPQRIASHEVAGSLVLDFTHLRGTQGELEDVGLEEPFHLGLCHRGNVVKARPPQILDLGALDHAPIPHKRHAFAAKAPRHLRDLGRQGGHIWGIPSTDIHRHRRALLVTQQPDDHLLLASFAVSVLAERGKGVALALQVTARDVVEKQCRLAVSTPGRA